MLGLHETVIKDFISGTRPTKLPGENLIRPEWIESSRHNRSAMIELSTTLTQPASLSRGYPDPRCQRRIPGMGWIGGSESEPCCCRPAGRLSARLGFRKLPANAAQ